MKRGEEIVTATLGCRQNYVELKRPITPDDVADAFEKGAKWADKTMIDKACQWITEHIDIPYEGEFIDNSPVASDYIEWCEKRLEYAKAIADAFKQAMEEKISTRYKHSEVKDLAAKVLKIKEEIAIPDNCEVWDDKGNVISTSKIIIREKSLK